MIFLFDLGFVKACGGGWVMGFDGGAGDGLWVVIVVMVMVVVMGFDRGGGGGDFCGDGGCLVYERGSGGDDGCGFDGDGGEGHGF